MMIYGIVAGIFVLVFLVLLFTPNDNKPLQDFNQERIDEFVVFAKQFTDLNQAEAIKKIREKFPELDFVQSVKIYHLAKNK